MAYRALWRGRLNCTEECRGKSMTYVISDIHGEYEQFMTILDKINFSEKDTL